MDVSSSPAASPRGGDRPPLSPVLMVAASPPGSSRVEAGAYKDADARSNVGAPSTPSKVSSPRTATLALTDEEKRKRRLEAIMGIRSPTAAADVDVADPAAPSSPSTATAMSADVTRQISISPIKPRPGRAEATKENKEDYADVDAVAARSPTGSQPARRPGSVSSSVEILHPPEVEVVVSGGVVASVLPPSKIPRPPKRPAAEQRSLAAAAAVESAAVAATEPAVGDDDGDGASEVLTAEQEAQRAQRKALKKQHAAFLKQVCAVMACHALCVYRCLASFASAAACSRGD